MTSKAPVAVARTLLQTAFSDTAVKSPPLPLSQNSIDESLSIVDDTIKSLLDDDDDDDVQSNESNDDKTTEADNDGVALTEAFGNDACHGGASNRFSVCTDSSFAKHVSIILAKDYNFVAVPKEYWFTSERGEKEDMYKPKNGVGCEWRDRSIFSFCDNRFENSIVLYSKVQLAELIVRHANRNTLAGHRRKDLVTPPTWIIRNGIFSTLKPPDELLQAEVSSDTANNAIVEGKDTTAIPTTVKTVYFLKDVS